MEAPIRGTGTVTIVAIAALALAVLSRSIAFVFAKYAALATADQSIAAILLNGWYWGEIAALGLQALFWLWTLRHLELAFAYPFMGLVYGLNLFWAYAIFDEPVSFTHILGCAIIIGGVILSGTPRKAR